MAKKPNEEALARAVALFDECRKDHDTFVEKVEDRYKTYRGILDGVSEAAQWTSKAHPPYIMHIVETSLASFVDDQLRYRIRPVPSLDFVLDPSLAEKAMKGATAHQRLFDFQVMRDKLTQKQRPFILQNQIAGLTVAKTYWTSRKERRRQMVPVREPLLDASDEPIYGPTGEPVMVTRMEETVSSQVVYDGPTTEVRDVRDWLWPSNATSLSTAPYVVDRVWKLREEIEREFSGGAFGPDHGGWSLKDVQDALSNSHDFSDDRNSREQSLFQIERTKGLVEVLEVWDRIHNTVTTVANRVALLSHKERFPFFHEGYPFSVCTMQPDLFRLAGVSQVEKIAHLQTLLWDISNQSLDNLRLVNNAIFWFRPDVEDPEGYEFYPGARWLVDDPGQVQAWSPNPIPAEVSLGREALLKGDMQNLAGGFPFSSGTDSQFVDQKTATGASLVSNIAQRGMDLQKQQVYAAFEDIGYQRMILNQQFIRKPTVAPVTSLDGEDIPNVIFPELLYGDYEFKLEPIPDAIAKQEEQAAAQAMLQMALAAYPVAAAAAQAGAATPLNLDAFLEDLLRAHGKEEFARYFRSAAPTALPGAGGGMAPPGAAPPGAAPMGVTGPGSIDPAVSPSSQFSLSPMMAQQRAMAMSRS